MGSTLNRLLDPVLRGLQRHRRVLLVVIALSAAIGAATYRLITLPVNAVVTLRAEQGGSDVVGVLSDREEQVLPAGLLVEFEVLLTARREGDPLYPRWRQARQAWQTGGSVQNWLYLDETLSEAAARSRAFGETLEGDADGAVRSRRLAQRFTISPLDGGVTGAAAWRVAFAAEKAEDPVNVLRLLADLIEDHAQRLWMRRMTAAETVATAKLEGFRAHRVATAEAALEKLINEDLPSPADVLLLEPLEGSPLADERAALSVHEKELNRLAGEWSATASLYDEVMDQFPVTLRPHTRLSALRPRGIAFAAGSPDDDPPPRSRSSPPSDLENIAERLDSRSLLLSSVKSVAVPESLMRANPMLTKLKQREAELATRLNLLKGEYPNDPGWMSGVERELLETRRTLLMELLGEARAMRVRAEGLERRLNEVGLAYDREANRVATLASLRPQYRHLAADLEDARRQAAEMSAGVTALRESRQRGEQKPVLRMAQGPELHRGEHGSALLAGVGAGLTALLIGMIAALLAERHTARLSASGVTAAIAPPAPPADVPVIGRIRWCEGGPVEEGG